MENFPYFQRNREWKWKLSLVFILQIEKGKKIFNFSNLLTKLENTPNVFSKWRTRVNNAHKWALFTPFTPNFHSIEKTQMALLE